jgi:flagellar FliL protein
MSAAAPTATEGAPAPAKKGKKKLIIIIAVALVLLLAVAGGAAVFLKKKAAHDAPGADEAAAAVDHKAAKPDLKHPPTFLPLDPFVVNLTDKEVDRYAQIGITLEVEDAHFAEELKAFMPAIRNGILMILAHKSSQDLLDRAGKEELAGEILRETSRTMGIEVEEPDPPAPKKAAEKSGGDKDADAAKPADADKDGADDDAKPKAKPAAKKAAGEPNPIKKVHFSNFIIQ